MKDLLLENASRRIASSTQTKGRAQRERCWQVESRLREWHGEIAEHERTVELCRNEQTRVVTVIFEVVEYMAVLRILQESHTKTDESHHAYALFVSR